MDVLLYLRLSLPDPVVPPPGLAKVGPVPGILRVPSISTHQAQIPRQWLLLLLFTM